VSLKTVHIVFVTFSTLLAFAFGGWSLNSYRSDSETVYLILGVGGLVCGVGLIVYGNWFWRKIRTLEEERPRKRKWFLPLPVAAALCVLGSRAAEACSVCYGEAEGPMIDAARTGVWLLFGLVFALQLAFVVFFVYLHRRAKRYRERHPEMQWAD